MSVMARVLILLGAPGAGKGTQAARLGAACSLPHVSTGDLFRANLREGTPLGKRVRSFLDAGELVPDDLVIEMLFDRVSRPDCAEGYLLDGFPRTLAQAKALEQRLTPKDELTVLLIDVPEKLLVERAAGRLLCKSCGNIQHLSFSPPAQPGICDRCGGELQQRSDDRPEVVRERLRVYHAETEPLVSAYASKGLLRRVDGSGTPDQVFDQLQTACGDGRS